MGYFQRNLHGTSFDFTDVAPDPAPAPAPDFPMAIRYPKASLFGIMPRDYSLSTDGQRLTATYNSRDDMIRHLAFVRARRQRIERDPLVEYALGLGGCVSGLVD